MQKLVNFVFWKVPRIYIFKSACRALQLCVAMEERNNAEGEWSTILLVVLSCYYLASSTTIVVLLLVDASESAPFTEREKSTDIKLLLST